MTCVFQVFHSCLSADDPSQPAEVFSHSTGKSNQQRNFGGFCFKSTGFCRWPLCLDFVISIRLSGIFQYLVSHVWA